MYREADGFAFVSLADGPPLGTAVVIATDGTHDSDAALQVGVELSRQHRVPFQVISVVEASDFIDYEGNSPTDVARATRAAIASREGELTAQRQRTQLIPAIQPAIRVGCRVDEIVRFASQHDASLIVMGAGSHGVLARLLNRHTVMRVAAATTIPILAVPSDGRPLSDPRVWLLATPQH